LAVNVTVGCGGGPVTVTVTAAVAAAEPPAPVQVNVKFVSAPSAAVAAVPLVASEPLQPPEAVHAVALVELQVRVEAAPLCTDVGSAVKVAVGCGAVGCTTELLPEPQAASIATARTMMDARMASPSWNEASKLMKCRSGSKNPICYL
jgi:hypothetical protein